MRPASLLERLQAHGARLDDPDATGGVPAVRHFGDASSEVAAAAERGGVRDQSAHGRIRVAGADRLEFLNSQCTNDLKALDESTAVVAALTTVKGRVIDLARVLCDGDTLVILTSAGQANTVREALAAKVVMEDCELTHLAEGWCCLLACGPSSAAAVEAVFGAKPAASAEHHGACRGRFAGSEVLLADALAPLGGVEILLPSGEAGAAFDALVEAGLQPLGEEAYDQLRIEEGIPALGREMGDHTNPLEAGLGFAVSFTKGCYVGQEVVARLHSRGKVKRQMVGLRFPLEIDPTQLDEVFWDLLRVGNVSSAVRSPRKNATLALALVKSDYTRPGTPVYSVKDSERMDGEVAELPF